MSGPVPNLESDLARPRSRKGGKRVDEKTTRGVRQPVDIPEADPTWHKIAIRWFNSLKVSGQAEFYQQSDWEFAYSLAEDLSLYKQPQVNKTTGEEYFKRSGQMLQTIYSAMERLMVTEGDRRRLRLELHDKSDVDTSHIAAVSDIREGLQKGKTK